VCTTWVLTVTLWYGENGWECAGEKLGAVEIVSKNGEGSENGSVEDCLGRRRLMSQPGPKNRTLTGLLFLR